MVQGRPHLCGYYFSFPFEIFLERFSMRCAEITHLSQFHQCLNGLTFKFNNFFALFGFSTIDGALVEILCVVSATLNEE